MSGFIDINRLDYVDPEQIYLPEKFTELQRLHRTFRYQAVEFLIKNSLEKFDARNQPPSFLAFRIFFRNLWEWHIPAVVTKLINGIKTQLPMVPYCKWDCLWILKTAVKSRFPVYFCDLIIFLPDDGYLRNFQEQFSRKFRNSNFISTVKVFKYPDITAADLAKFCLRGNTCKILKCEFAHNISTGLQNSKINLTAVSNKRPLPAQADGFAFPDTSRIHNPEIRTDLQDCHQTCRNVPE